MAVLYYRYSIRGKLFLFEKSYGYLFELSVISIVLLVQIKWDVEIWIRIADNIY
jgi:hypothetical protein